MRNIRHTVCDPIYGLRLVGGKLKKTKTIKGRKVGNPTYNVYNSEKETLESLYDEYNSKVNPCQLQTLTPFYKSKATCDALYDLYSPDKKFLKELREEVTKVDNELILCPYCGKNVVDDLDHYIPRSVMPEYSVHCLNLIPLCHRCNNAKKEQWLEGGRRLFYNAYFDEHVELADVISMNIDISDLTGAPCVEVSLMPIDQKNDSDALFAAKKTVEKLDLIDLYWQGMAKDELRELIAHFINRYPVYAKLHPEGSKERFLLFEFECLRLDLASLPESEQIKKLLYETLVESDICKEWLMEHLQN